ncbi:hypothetical protein BWI17_11765 [Betaproteobacteria bacterium GR16-43]|nr:hypothetical protein BWI17_11765 [Betaproteobacteria bacterium GR16-43]
MNFFIWAFAGAALGWITFSAIGWNEGRGRFVSIVIGVVGGLMGGRVLAPLFADAPTIPPNTDFAMMPLIVAIVVAIAFLVAGDQIDKRWGA